jgi:hypothetical protein
MGNSSLASSFDTSLAARLATGMLVYNRGGAAITLREAPGSTKLADEPIGPAALVTVRVVYMYRCSVPIASRILCRPGYDLAGLTEVAADLQRIYGDFSFTNARETGERLERLRDEVKARGRELGELATELGRVESTGLQLPLLVSSARYEVLQGEASLSNQGAAYYAGSDGGHASTK